MTHPLSGDLRKLCRPLELDMQSAAADALRRAADALDAADENAEFAHDLRRENLDGHLRVVERSMETLRQLTVERDELRRQLSARDRELDDYIQVVVRQVQATQKAETLAKRYRDALEDYCHGPDGDLARKALSDTEEKTDD